MAMKKALAIGIVGIIAATALIIGIIDLNLPDTSPPDVDILSPTFTAYEGDSVSVNLYAFDNRGIDRVWFNWNGINVSYTGVTQVSFTPGLHTLYV